MLSYVKSSSENPAQTWRERWWNLRNNKITTKHWNKHEINENNRNKGREIYIEFINIQNESFTALLYYYVFTVLNTTWTETTDFYWMTHGQLLTSSSISLLEYQTKLYLRGEKAKFSSEFIPSMHHMLRMPFWSMMKKMLQRPQI